MDHLTFHLVSPEKSLASLEVETVSAPGMEGDITLLPNHADFLTTLRPGIIKIGSVSGEQNFVVTGGFMEVSGSVVTVLAEKAVLKTDANKELFEPFIVDAKEESRNATAKERARTDIRLNDLRAISDMFS